MDLTAAAHREEREKKKSVMEQLKSQPKACLLYTSKRFRKWGGIPTGITQNVKDLLSSREVENIFENSDFVYMLNQAGGDLSLIHI